MAQLGERQVRNLKVGGSIPPVSTIKNVWIVRETADFRRFYCFTLRSVDQRNSSRFADK